MGDLDGPGETGTVSVPFEGPAGQRRFQAIVPEDSFQNGANRIQVFVVAQTKEEVVLPSPPEDR